jgi:predicted small integral membrane protein
MSWMAWTVPTAVFFIVLAALLTAMTVWEVVSPTVARRGVLPLVTTRGDRLFIGLLGSAFLNLGWIGFTEFDQWWAVGLSAVLLALVGRYG